MIRKAEIRDSRAISSICTEELGYPCNAQFVAQRLSGLKPDRARVFVAEEDGLVVGFVHAEKYTLLYQPDRVNILGLAVSDRSRRQGIGKQLLEAVESWAKENGIFYLRLNSGSTRTEVHRFYRSMGFGEEREQIRFLKQLK